MPVRLSFTALVLWCLLATAACAATPVTVGPGSRPHVAVDASGTGYVAWIQSAGNTDTFRYCKLAPTARACAAAFSFANGDQDVDGGWPLLLPDGRVLLVEARGVSPAISKLQWTSTDRGVSFQRAHPDRQLATSGAGISGRALYAPAGALGLGERFRVTLKWRRQKRKGNLFVKVRRADFYLGSRVIKVDTRVPFVHTYNVTVRQRPGSTISLRARAFIKVRRGKSPKKSIRTKVRVCR